MIKSITVTNPFNKSLPPLEMSLRNPEQSGFFVKSIDGLGPVKANVSISEYASSDGGRFQSARLPYRNIVLNLGFMWIPTIEDARLKTYQYFPLKKKIFLEIVTDKRRSTIEGYVESNEPDIFSNEEGCQISIICPDPYFHSDEYEKVISGSSKLFSFEFSNDSLTEKKIVFADILDSMTTEINFNGTVSSGLVIKMVVNSTISSIQISNSATSETMLLNSSKISSLGGFITGDVITISTYSGNKYISLLRGTSTYNIINSMDRINDLPLMWLTLTPGLNPIEIINPESPGSNPDIDATILYKEQYEGI